MANSTRFVRYLAVQTERESNDLCRQPSLGRSQWIENSESKVTCRVSSGALAIACCVSRWRMRSASCSWSSLTSWGNIKEKHWVSRSLTPSTCFRFCFNVQPFSPFSKRFSSTRSVFESFSWLRVGSETATFPISFPEPRSLWSGNTMRLDVLTSWLDPWRRSKDRGLWERDCNFSKTFSTN